MVHFEKRIPPEPFAACLFLALLLLAGCGQGRPSPGPSPATPTALTTFAGQYPIRVVTTTGPVTDMVRSLGGEHLDVTGLMGPGVDPHLYREVPSDIERLAAADVIFYNGLHLEGRMADTLERLARRRPTFAVTHRLVESRDARLRKPPEFEGYFDPHVWHDAELWADCAGYVADVLAEFDPQHRDDYERNRDAYQAELRAADRYCRDRIAVIPAEQRVLVTAHDAFGYFCSAYDLEGVPLKGISTEEEVSIGRIDEVIDLIVERRIRAVFVETAVAPQIVRSLIRPARARGQEVRIGGELYADALGPPSSGADTCAGMLRTNVDTIVAALTGGAPATN